MKCGSKGTVSLLQDSAFGTTFTQGADTSDVGLSMPKICCYRDVPSVGMNALNYLVSGAVFLSCANSRYFISHRLLSHDLCGRGLQNNY